MLFDQKGFAEITEKEGTSKDEHFKSSPGK